MRYKEGVSRKSLEPIMSLALHHLDNIFNTYDKELVIKSTYDGNHKEGSLHYLGLAVDIRTRASNTGDVVLYPNEIKDIEKKFQRIMKDKRFQFVIEKTHLHLEYDRRIKNA